jgi:hypothetical protein
MGSIPGRMGAVTSPISRLRPRKAVQQQLKITNQSLG